MVSSGGHAGSSPTAGSATSAAGSAGVRDASAGSTGVAGEATGAAGAGAARQCLSEDIELRATVVEGLASINGQRIDDARVRPVDNRIDLGCFVVQ